MVGVRGRLGVGALAGPAFCLSTELTDVKTVKCSCQYWHAKKSVDAVDQQLAATPAYPFDCLLNSLNALINGHLINKQRTDQKLSVYSSKKRYRLHQKIDADP
jgi:hypothetical protein